MDTPKKLGTFLGVFTPSVLTILGVIMYLRTGWVVGNAGLFPTIAIVTLANGISLATALSVSAVATNMRVGAGGAYYIISRSLGLEVGGAIGIPLFLAQALSTTLYAFGLAESLTLVWPDLPIQIVAAVTILGVGLLSAKGASIALKLQLPIMAAVGLSILSLVLGADFQGERPIIWGAYGDADGFWDVFAVFFPAVTGIMAGISMSGDLKDPARAIPLGSVAAVGVGFAAYLAVPTILSLNADPETLLSDPMVWATIALVPSLILPGLWGAILSSAIGSSLGAPRTLQALAEDQILPRVLTRYPLATGESKVAILASTGISLLAVLAGDLNAVAPLVTMFFLTTYGTVNLVAGLEVCVGDPSYRPSLRIPWPVSIAGAVACFWVMFVINSTACMGAIAIEIGIWSLIKRRDVRSTFGDVRRGLWLALARTALVNLKVRTPDPRNWRPNILLFAGDVEKRKELVRFASRLNQNRGILTVCNLIVEEVTEDTVSRIYEEELAIEDLFYEENLVAFSEANVVENFESGVFDILQANGVGELTSNTIMFGWTDHEDRFAAYFRIMAKAEALKRSTVICRIAPRATLEQTRQIDVWWRGKQYNGDMMLLLAHLLSLNPGWRDATITIKSIATSEHTKDNLQAELDELLPRTRIQAESKVILKPEDKSVKEVMVAESREAEVVFIGLMKPESGQEIEYAKRMKDLVEGFPTVVLVRNGGWFAGQLL